LAKKGGKRAVYAGALVSNNFHKIEVCVKTLEWAIYHVGAHDAITVPVS
jgi:hypothetical protein